MQAQAGSSDTAATRVLRPIHAVLLLTTCVLTALVTAVLGPVLPKMQAHFADVPHAEYLVPLTLTVPMLMMAFLSIVAGGLSDRYGRKRMLEPLIKPGTVTGRYRARPPPYDGR